MPEFLQTPIRAARYVWTMMRGIIIIRKNPPAMVDPIDNQWSCPVTQV